MAATDSMPVPKKNTAFRHYFYLLDSSGAAITGATGLDSEVSKDGGSYADCTNEATEVGQGLYYIDLTSTEMNADVVALLVKTSSANAIPERVVFAPAPSTGSNAIPTQTTSMASDVVTASAIAANAITSAKIASDAIGANQLADTATAEIADAVWNEATSEHLFAGTTGESISLVNFVDAKTTNLPDDPADASVIAASFTTVNTTLGTIAGYIDTEVAAIKTKTDNLPSNTATELAAIKSDTAAILVDTNELQTDWANGGRLDLLLDACSTLTQAQVLTKMNEALDTAIAELSAGTPAVTPSMRTALMLIYMHLRNNSEDTQTTRKIRNDAGTVIAQATLTSSSTGVAQGKLGAPS